VRVACPSDFDIGFALGYLTARAIPSIERAEAPRYSRVYRIAGGTCLIETWFVALPRGEVAAEISTSRGGFPRSRATEVIERQFSLGADLAAFVAMAGRHPILAPLVARQPGLRLPGIVDPFECLVRAIVGQLVSVRAATRLLGRLVSRFGEETEVAGWRAFPTAAALASEGQARLRQIGLTAAKAATIETVSRAVISGDLDWSRLQQEPPAVVDRTLRAFRGIGSWTSGYVRLRSFGDPDAFLPTDLGIVKAMTARGVARSDIEPVADAWRPWRGLAVAHLWASLAL
jgi:3-methyladenine DNA glycosylase/8-oxoguanine DNA glycosylase